MHIQLDKVDKFYNNEYLSQYIVFKNIKLNQFIEKNTNPFYFIVFLLFKEWK